MGRGSSVQMGVARGGPQPARAGASQGWRRKRPAKLSIHSVKAMPIWTAPFTKSQSTCPLRHSLAPACGAAACGADGEELPADASSPPQRPRQKTTPHCWPTPLLALPTGRPPTPRPPLASPVLPFTTPPLLRRPPAPNAPGRCARGCRTLCRSRPSRRPRWPGTCSCRRRTQQRPGRRLGAMPPLGRGPGKHSGPNLPASALADITCLAPPTPPPCPFTSLAPPSLAHPTRSPVHSSRLAHLAPPPRPPASTFPCPTPVLRPCRSPSSARKAKALTEHGA